MKNYKSQMNKLPLLVVTLLLSISCFSQNVVTAEDAKGKAKEYYERADNDYAFGKLWQADSLLNLAVKEKDNFIDAWLLIGQINLEFLKKYDVALNAYQKAKLLQPDYTGDINYQIARCEMHLADYANAKTHLSSFLQQQKIAATQRLTAEKMLTDCDFAVDAMKHPVDFKPINLGPGVNTSDDESMPSLTADGKYI
jgi:tetratricopeptide (TPR) repeat protein